MRVLDGLSIAGKLYHATWNTIGNSVPFPALAEDRRQRSPIMDSGNAVLDVDLFTMSNLSPKRTGLPFVVWISPRGGAQHDVRVKVTRGPKAIPGEFVTVTVRPRVEVIDGSLPPRDLELLRRWIERNRD